MATSRKRRTSLKGMTIGQAKAVLLERAKRTGAELYDALRLAAWLLDGEFCHDFLAEFKGDRVSAIQHLEDTYFPLVKQILKLEELLQLFNTFSEEEWAEHRYDLKAMHILATKPEPDGDPPRTSWRKLYEEAKDKLTSVEAELKDAHYDLATVQKEVRDLKRERDNLVDRVERLERENAYLRGRLDEIVTEVPA